MQCKGESSSPTRRTAHGHDSSMGLDERPHNIGPEACPTGTTLPARSYTVERFEHAGLLVRCDPWAMIGDADGNGIAALTNVNRNRRAGRCIFHRVAHEIVKNLLDS